MKKNIAVFIAFLGTAFAGTPDPKIVQKVETYLNGIKSYRATIEQTSDTGESRSGHIYMLRDGKKTYGKLRLEYDAPAKDLFIVDGEQCRFYDAQAKESQDLNVDDTPASFLLAKRIDLANRLKVVDQTITGTDVRLKVVRSGDESGGFLVLKFSMDPILKLNGWSLKDPQGITHEIHLENVNIGIELDSKLFVIR